MKPYTEIDGLEDIVLEESYVLGLTATPGQLFFKVDFVLTTDHPLYQPPPLELSSAFGEESFGFRPSSPCSGRTKALRPRGTQAEKSTTVTLSGSSGNQAATAWKVTGDSSEVAGGDILVTIDETDS